MAGSKRDRQRASRQQAMAEAAEARRRAETRRNLVAGAMAAVAVALIAVVVVVLTRGGGGSKRVAVASPTSAAPSRTTAGASPTSPATGPTTAALASAAGKPCVAPSGPTPAGAPAVAVRVGAPPAQLVAEDVRAGTGATVAAGQTLTVNYIGVACSTGKIFDTSYGKQPATFPLGQVIKGWQDGIPGMKVGGQRLLGIPPVQAYAAQGYPPDIAPNETLWFVVEVLKAV